MRRNRWRWGVTTSPIEATLTTGGPCPCSLLNLSMCQAWGGHDTG